MRVIFLALSVASVASATFFQDCGSVGSDVVLNVEDCDVPPCLLERGSTYSVNIQFTSSMSSDALTIDASASLAGINVPWPGIDTDACKQLEGGANPCPFSAGSRVDWTMPVAILSEYPALSTVVTFKLKDAAGGPQACTVVPVTLV
ncbi:NPC intracellular cholesterol transporter 2-like [Penaeus japonicus]|uniref:NPC intracellular cholesterol transporter 2-like n=1 Tax=Penaeus japonicus TaxID=27405 RepID=UPI001C7145C1|nr:NPC intracellular cholesterol transporter 2-like [Penaeus japonicus]